MSYGHVLVKHIEQATTELKAKPFAGQGKMLDGIGVTPECYALAVQLRNVYRNVRFGVALEHSPTIAVPALYAYLPNQTYAMGYIGYQNVGLGKKLFRYFVTARTIRNEKYHPTRDQYYMMSSANINQIVKAIKKYVRPYNPIECARITIRPFVARLEDTKSEAATKESSIRRTIIYDCVDSLREELFGMLDRGYEFTNLKLREQVEGWRTQYKRRVQSDGEHYHAYYVQVRLDAEGKQVFDLIKVFDMLNPSSCGNNKFNPSPQDVIECRVEELPDEVTHKIAALSMVPDGHYVPELGMRMTETEYWVHQ